MLGPRRYLVQRLDLASSGELTNPELAESECVWRVELVSKKESGGWTEGKWKLRPFTNGGYEGRKFSKMEAEFEVNGPESAEWHGADIGWSGFYFLDQNEWDANFKNSFTAVIKNSDNSKCTRRE